MSKGGREVEPWNSPVYVYSSDNLMCVVQTLQTTLALALQINHLKWSILPVNTIHSAEELFQFSLYITTH
jgi:hypothetical protein